MSKGYLKVESNWMDILDTVEFHDKYVRVFLNNNKQEIEDYEAFDDMHEFDGTFTKSERSSSL